MSELAELMARDPLSLSDQDLDAIILRLRQAQAQYSLGEKKAGNPKNTTKAKTNVSDKSATDLLASLGLLPGPGESK